MSDNAFLFCFIYATSNESKNTITGVMEGPVSIFPYVKWPRMSFISFYWIYYFFVDDNFFLAQVGSCYEGGKFKIEATFPLEYPFKAPVSLSLHLTPPLFLLRGQNERLTFLLVSSPSGCPFRFSSRPSNFWRGYITPTSPKKVYSA
jgi:hypothetical protein